MFTSNSFNTAARYGKLGKAVLTAPLYISIAWSMIISYQLFTQTAVYSVVNFLSNLWMPLANLLASNLHMIVFIHTFAWIFVLSSVIPSAIIGRERSIFLQFVLCLTVALVAVSIEDILTLVIGVNPASQMQNLFVWFRNPLIAGIYLSAPYLFMLFLDLRSRRKKQMSEEGKIGVPEMEYSEQSIDTMLPIKSAQGESRAGNTATKGRESETDQVPQTERTRRVNFLHGTSIICFLLALFTFLSSNTLPLSTLTIPYKLIYPAVLTILAIILLVLGFEFSKIQRQEIMPITRQATEREEEIEGQETYFEPSAVEPVKASLERQTLEHSETSSKEILEQPESLVEVQIADLYQEIPIKMEKYDVRHPKEVIDSQC